MFKQAVILSASVALLVGCDNKPKETAEPPPMTAAQTAAQAATNNDAKPEAAATAGAEEEEGQWIGDDTYGVKFRVAEDWKLKQGEKSLSATSADDTITVLLVGTEGGGVITSAINSIKEEVQFKDLKLEKDAAIVVNGLPGQTAAGSAVLIKEEGDQEIQFLMNAVKVGDKGVALMVFAEAEMYEARKEEVQGILKTLQAK